MAQILEKTQTKKESQLKNPLAIAALEAVWVVVVALKLELLCQNVLTAGCDVCVCVCGVSQKKKKNSLLRKIPW